VKYDEVRLAAVDELRGLLAEVDAAEVEGFTRAVAGARRVFTAGAGRSGLAVRGFTMRLMHLGLSVHPVGDMTTPPIGAGDLLVIGSGSGATPSLVAMSEKARAAGARVALVTTAPGSPIGRTAEALVRIPAPTPKAAPAAAGTAGSAAGSAAVPSPAAAAGKPGIASRQPMATLFEQALWILLDTCVLLLMEEKGQDTKEMFGRHANLE